MTTTAESRIQCHLKKFGSEVRPPPISRRDDRIRSIASSFEEITESEEEELQDSMPYYSESCGRSPYAVQSESPFSQRRSNSLTHTPCMSPKFAKRTFPNRLMRGFSDPLFRRKSSLPTILQQSSDGFSSDSSSDLLSLPPIPEAATPASPVSSSPSNLFKDSNSF
ncbi:unnamed protein product [Auanema sp. JU1783]|nr:unnamed protein product [Auanema sp. JU1783]